MGRLSHLTRLALGRSAFGEALRDEDGNFIISEHAAENDAAGYTQQFNDRGRPINDQTIRADRRLRRAQNEVLKVVGVVRSKHDKYYRDTRQHQLTNEQLVDLVSIENASGRLLQTASPLAMDVVSWWVMSFRSRIMVRIVQEQLAPAHVDADVSVLYSTRPVRWATIRCAVLGNHTFLLFGLDIPRCSRRSLRCESIAFASAPPQAPASWINAAPI